MNLPPVKPVAYQEKATLNDVRAQLVAVVVEESHLADRQIVDAALAALDTGLGGVVRELVELGDFEGKWIQISSTLSGNRTVARRVMLLGAGKKQDQPAARARHLGLVLAEEAGKLKAASVAVVGNTPFLDKRDLREQMAIGFRMGVYKYPNPNLSDEAKAQLETPVELQFVGTPVDGPVRYADVGVMGRAIEQCRLLQDGPANVVTPRFVAEVAGERARALGLDVQIWGAAKLREMGFGAMLAVAGGSMHEPQFVVIDYKPEGFTKSLALVGKGLTFDTGGYSLKQPTSQVGMKYDMSGAAVTLSAALAIAELRLPIRVFGIAALCENMVDAHAYRVNDIVKAYNGKTIEILNTDAEGRVVLADALSYTAQELKPNAIVEFSTLTGAVVVALGHFGAGVYSFAETDLAAQINAAAEVTGERVWQMPVWDDLQEEIKGKIADVNNIGATAGSAGSMVAAAFLKEFVGGVPFAHLDIAGMANDAAALGYPKKTGSGFGVQIAVELARQMGRA
jgi:leucyl aminopeptidase